MGTKVALCQLGTKLKAHLSTGLILAFLVGTLAPGVHSTECVSPNSRALKTYASARIVVAETFTTAADTMFGAQIEAAAVDKSGSIFATDFSSGTATLGQIANAFGYINQQLFYNGTMPTATMSPWFNGLRFVPTASASFGEQSIVLAADVNDHSVVQISRGVEGVSSTVFCNHSTMVQPNDIAIAQRSGRVYASGQNYTANTVVGDGALWMCGSGVNGSLDSPVGLPVKALRLGLFGRTNGIEVSPDEKRLYLSEAFNNNSIVVSNKVWRFDIDPRSGYVWNQTLFVDFNQLDGSGAVDVDGMRTDADGNLFVTRNGGGEVIKFSSKGDVLLRIQLPSIKYPSNLELGGPDGTSLFVVGQCAAQPANSNMGCVDVWHGNPVPGRAFHDLNNLQ